MEPLLRAGVIVAVFMAMLAGFAIRAQQSAMGPSGYGFSTVPEDIIRNFTAHEFEDKVALVTGASSGIGWEVAQVLASKGFHVIVMARTYAKAGEAVSRLKAYSAKAKLGEPKLTPLACDLGSLAEIEAAVQSFSDLNLPLHLLINNAAEMSFPSNRTSENFEIQMGANYFGHMHLTTLLMPFLTASAPSRVVNVVSTLHRLSSGSFLNQPDMETPHSTSLAAYADSKMALIIATQNLNNRFYHNGVSFYSASPGFSSAHLEANVFTLFNQMGPKAFLTAITGRKDSRHASASIIYAALRAPKEHSGTYFENCNIKDSKNLKILHELSIMQDFGNETERLIADKIRLANPETSRQSLRQKQASKSF